MDFCTFNTQERALLEVNVKSGRYQDKSPDVCTADQNEITINRKEFYLYTHSQDWEYTLHSIQTMTTPVVRINLLETVCPAIVQYASFLRSCAAFCLVDTTPLRKQGRAFQCFEEESRQRSIRRKASCQRQSEIDVAQTTKVYSALTELDVGVSSND